MRPPPSTNQNTTRRSTQQQHERELEALLVQKDEEITSLLTTRATHLTKLALLQLRLLHALDTIDEYAQENSELRKEFGVVRRKVRASEECTGQPRHIVSTFIATPPYPPPTLPQSPPNRNRYAPLITYLRSMDLSTEQAEHARTQACVAALEERVARWKAELDGCACMEMREMRRREREIQRDKKEEAGDEVEMEEEEITAMLDMTVASNRKLESEIRGLSERYLPVCPHHVFLPLPERDVDISVDVDADSVRQHSEEMFARRSRQSHQHSDNERRDKDQGAYAEQGDGGRGRLTWPLGVLSSDLGLERRKSTSERRIVFAQRNTNTDTNALNGTSSSDMAISVFDDGCSVPILPSAPSPASVPVPALAPVHVPDVPKLMNDDNEDGDADSEMSMELATPLMPTSVISMTFVIRKGWRRVERRVEVVMEIIRGIAGCACVIIG
ncbi:hypothetical protein CVT25_008366 [Psilocybe cyanescens]|uniref:Uncharacterized protein n=1 Tax=Psilocybe cyanescens TaxID=93625 RepID=A0A409WVC8_PSICY|nr:hypothetical protein CVT25_008366 [Psilocybe cyanescens]